MPYKLSDFRAVDQQALIGAAFNGLWAVLVAKRADGGPSLHGLAVGGHQFAEFYQDSVVPLSSIEGLDAAASAAFISGEVGHE